MVYGFVKQSNDHIRVRSDMGQGISISLLFPRLTQDYGRVEIEERTSEVPPRGSERVLLVEDDPLVRDYARGQLQSLGYTVVQADSAEHALHLLGTDSTIDLLFTDMLMPGGLNGYELAQRARDLRPDIAVLYTSGYTEHPVAGSASLPDAPLVSKPYLRMDLAKKIRQALAGS